MKVEELNLVEPALSAARALAKAHPAVVFTSGRRAVADQARAMSQNIIKNRKWVVQTYRATPQSAQLQKWVDQHPRAGQGEIQAGFVEIMNKWTPEERGHLSKHFSGLAFDVAPIGGTAGAAIKATIRKLPGLKTFLEQEGGLTRWHAQF